MAEAFGQGGTGKSTQQSAGQLHHRDRGQELTPFGTPAAGVWKHLPPPTAPASQGLRRNIQAFNQFPATPIGQAML